MQLAPDLSQARSDEHGGVSNSGVNNGASATDPNGEGFLFYVDPCAVSKPANWVGQITKESKPITGETMLAELRTLRHVRTPATEYEFFPNGTTLRTLGVFDVQNGQRHLLQIYRPTN